MNGVLAEIERQADVQPAKIALRSGSRSLSYAQLWNDVRLLTERLRERRVASLGNYLDNGIDWILVDLAGMAAQIRVVPLPKFFSRGQIDHAIEDGAVDHLACDSAAGSGVVGTGAPAPLYDASWIEPLEQRRQGASLAGGAKLSYTSGSTGNPKGIDLPYSFICQTCESICEAVSGLGIESHLSVLPYATLLENIAGVYVPLMLGKTVYAESASSIGLSADLRIDPVKLAREFTRTRPDSLILTPQLLEFFCHLAEHGQIDTGCLKFVAVGGARVGEVLMCRARRAGIPAYEGYGLTEFASVATLNTPRADRIGSVGKPLPGVEIEIDDDGEICLSATIDAQGRSYTRRVETGDYGSVDADGFVHVRGRKSNLIVLSSGRNLSPEWVETELSSSPLIRQSFVYTADSSAVSALVVAADPALADDRLADEIQRINSHLPRYARIKNWRRMPYPFSTENRMLTTNGRLRRQRILQKLPELCRPGVTDAVGSSLYSLQETIPC